ncbi:MAG: sensor histidine kinase [Thiomonas sp.]
MPWLMAPARVVSIAPVDVAGRRGPAMALESDDLIEEPDVFDSYTEMRRLFARQERIAVMLRGLVLLRRVGAGGEPHDTRLTPAPWRPPQSLTPMFWFQLAVGAPAWLLSAWVWVLRPHDWAARMLAAAGLLLLATTAAAAVYSARELALPGGLFRGLSAINHPGAVSFGMSLVGLFMMYPRPLAPPSSLHALVHEAASNSMRHAMASRISISLSCEGGQLHLRIGDDGAGFDPDQVYEGQGLRNMRTRPGWRGALALTRRPHGGWGRGAYGSGAWSRHAGGHRLAGANPGIGSRHDAAPKPGRPALGGMTRCRVFSSWL